MVEQGSSNDNFKNQSLRQRISTPDGRAAQEQQVKEGISIMLSEMREKGPAEFRPENQSVDEEGYHPITESQTLGDGAVRSLPIGQPDTVLLEVAIERYVRVVSSERDRRMRGIGAKRLDGTQRSKKINSLSSPHS